MARHAIISSKAMLQREPSWGTRTRVCGVVFHWRYVLKVLRGWLSDWGLAHIKATGAARAYFPCGPCSWGGSGSQVSCPLRSPVRALRTDSLHDVPKSKTKHFGLTVIVQPGPCWTARDTVWLHTERCGLTVDLLTWKILFVGARLRSTSSSCFLLQARRSAIPASSTEERTFLEELSEVPAAARSGSVLR